MITFTTYEDCSQIERSRLFRNNATNADIDTHKKIAHALLSTKYYYTYLTQQLINVLQTSWRLE